MSDETTPKTIEEIVLAIPEDKIVTPIIPVDITIGEAGSLNQFGTEDEPVLLAKGLKKGLIQQLTPSAIFLQEKQSIWIAVYQSSLSNTEAWKTKIDEGSLLQRELKHDFQFAYRHHPDILKRLDNIIDGNGNMDLIQDLSDYSAFAKQYPEPLTAILFDTSKIDRAKQISLDLVELMNLVDGVKNSKNRPEKIMRDRAYTHLKQLVDEIRDYGKYAFWNDEEKRKRYSSEYLRKGRERNEA